MLCRTPRDLPSVGKLMEDPAFRDLGVEFGDALLKSALRELITQSRQRLLDGDTVELESLASQVRALLQPGQKRVLNLTGTVLHTNLGRAPLGKMLASVAGRLSGYSLLEFDLETGKRGKRGGSVERLLCWVTGAEAALLVNNCAAALILLLTTLAKDREVIVSRGELVEIGGGFRVPEILALSGATLVEVGTTNRTRIADYEKAIGDNTALLLTTHRSNFEIVGFTESPTREELLELGARHKLPVAYDLGSGMLSPVVEGEPTVAGALPYNLTTFSGDKLLGGPQCGVLVGEEHLIERCRSHPLYRAFRCDKLTLALMEEVIHRHAADPNEVPAIELLSADPGSLRRRAQDFLSHLSGDLPAGLRAEVVESRATVGGGSAPGRTLPSVAVSLTPEDGGSAEALRTRLRQADPPIIARMDKGSVLLDFRAQRACDDEELLRTVRRIFT